MFKFKKYIVISIAAHVLILLIGLHYYPYLIQSSQFSSQKHMKIVHHRMNEPRKVKPKDIDIGQIVDLPTPVIEEKPEKSDYLAEHNHKVPEETKTDNYRINPKIVAEQFTPKDNLQFEEAIDVNANEPSSGAKVGNNQFKPNKLGSRFALPSPFAITNKDGLEKPTMASSTTENLSGAPNNDLLRERTSDRTQLNAHAYKYASYMNQIRRLVNFYWQQNLDNLQTPLYKNTYNTVVQVQITQHGELHFITVSKESGDPKIDECVTKAFSLAAPFPEPPELLIENGIVDLPDFGFELTVSSGQARYDGIDPRAGVRFPGILKAPR